MSKDTGAGVPAWMVTFADLMALMMTFFVLLYSFSSIDENKYRMIAQSMAEGFGSVLTATKTPSSTSIGPPSMMPSPMQRPTGGRGDAEAQETQAQELRAQLQQSLQSEIAEGIIAIETTGNTVVIRFPEDIAFPPGSDVASDAIDPILKRVAAALEKSPGTIMISGHTDDTPIRSAQFGSNWELSTDRAVSVIHRLQTLSDIEPGRLTAVGYGDTRPLAPNDSPANRAKNRRVEIAIVSDGS